MILRRITRKIALLLAILVPGALGLACPAKDLDIEVTPPNTLFIAASCNVPKACTLLSAASCAGTKACALDGNTCRGICRIPGNPEPELDGALDLQVLLFSTNPAGARKPSACVPVPRCDAGEPSCSAKALNAAIAQSLASGPALTFQGFNDTSDAIAAVAIFKRPDPTGDPAPPSCAPDHLVACAGLDVAVGKDTLDIECASCQGGAKNAVGGNTRPCPPNLLGPELCFLRTCFLALDGALPP